MRKCPVKFAASLRSGSHVPRTIAVDGPLQEKTAALVSPSDSDMLVRVASFRHRSKTSPAAEASKRSTLRGERRRVCVGQRTDVSIAKSC